MHIYICIYRVCASTLCSPDTKYQGEEIAAMAFQARPMEKHLVYLEHLLSFTGIPKVSFKNQTSLCVHFLEHFLDQITFQGVQSQFVWTECFIFDG